MMGDKAWRQVLVLGLIGGTAIIVAGFLAGDGERYRAVALPQGGLWRLDARTGAVSLCLPRGGAVEPPTCSPWSR